MAIRLTIVSRNDEFLFVRLEFVNDNGFLGMNCGCITFRKEDFAILSALLLLGCRESEGLVNLEMEDLTTCKDY